MGPPGPVTGFPLPLYNLAVYEQVLAIYQSRRTEEWCRGLNIGRCHTPQTCMLGNQGENPKKVIKVGLHVHFLFCLLLQFETKSAN